MSRLTERVDEPRSVAETADGSTDPTETLAANVTFHSDTDGSQLDVQAILTGTGSLNDRLMKAYLDEVLLILIMSHDGACGQDLVQDLYRLGSGLSPGTIYPHLHDLADDGLLEMHEQRRTKQFEVTDTEAVKQRVEEAFQDLSVLSSVFMLCDSDDDAGTTHDES